MSACVRILLIRWSALVEELTEEEAQLQKGVSERWEPFLAAHTDVTPIMSEPLSKEPAFAELPPLPMTDEERTPLRTDTRFRNHVLDRFKWQLLALRDIEPLQEAVAEILALLESELH